MLFGTLLPQTEFNIIDLDIIYNQYKWQQENVTKITMGQVVWGLEIFGFKCYCIIVGDGCSADGKFFIGHIQKKIVWS